MITVEYEKPLRVDSIVIFHVNTYTLTATVKVSLLLGNTPYYLYFGENHQFYIKILTDYYEDSLFNVFGRIISEMYNAAWPHTTLKDLEKILDNISIFDEF